MKTFFFFFFSFPESTGTTALHSAVLLGSVLATRRLLNGGACPLYQCKSTGSTPLHLAANAGNPEILSILLESISSHQIDIRDNVIHIYIFFSPFQSLITIYIIVFLPCISIQIDRTPLHRASYQGNSKCVEILIDHGGNLAAKTGTGVTVIDAIFAHIPTPVLLLNDILDSCVKMNCNGNSQVSHYPT